MGQLRLENLELRALVHKLETRLAEATAPLSS
jgi:hypothetical protein